MERGDRKPESEGEPHPLTPSPPEAVERGDRKSESAWGWWLALQGLVDPLQGRGEVVLDLVVAETEDAVAVVQQQSVACFIGVGLAIVDRAVDFDDQPATRGSRSRR